MHKVIQKVSPSSISYTFVRYLSLSGIRLEDLPPRNEVYEKKKTVIYSRHPLLPHHQDPLKRAITRAKEEFSEITYLFTGKEMPLDVKAQSDIVIIGDGYLATAVAYALKKEIQNKCNVIIIENQNPQIMPPLLNVATNGLYQTVPSKIKSEMALFGAQFYLDLTRNAKLENCPVSDLEFTPCSSLLLATEKGASSLEHLSEIYGSRKWRHRLVNSQMLREFFPWLNSSDITVGCLGLCKEGLINEWTAYNLMRSLAIKYGAEYVQAEILGFQFQNMGDFLTYDNQFDYYLPNGVVLKMGDEVATLNCGIILIVGGSRTHEITEMLNVEQVKYVYPNESRNSYAFEFTCSETLPLDTPMVIEPNGLRFRKLGLSEDYVAWLDPKAKGDLDTDGVTVDENFFAERVLPLLTDRVPAFKNAKVTQILKGAIDFNPYDENIVFGQHPCFKNIVMASGLANDEFLFAPSIAKGFEELLLTGKFKTIDFKEFDFKRIDEHEILEDIKVV